MQLTTRVVVQDEPGARLSYREAELAAPGPHGVVVDMRASGVCHSQLATMSWQRSAPLLFGHEGLGTVVRTGAAVSGLDEGLSVLISWLPRSGHEGRRVEPGQAWLPANRRMAVAPNVYTWAEHCLVDEVYVTPLPAGTDEPEAAVLGCAVVTGMGTVCTAAPVTVGSTVAVYGVGGVGLCAVAGARMRNAGRIIAVDRGPRKLDFARRFGATDTVDVNRTDPVEAIRQITADARGVDLAVDCVGTEHTLRQALKSVRSGTLGARRGGTVALVGLPPATLTIDAEELLRGEKSLVGSCGGSSETRDIARFADWCRQGHLDLRALVTDRFTFDQVPDAVEALRRGEILGRALITMK